MTAERATRQITIVILVGLAVQSVIVVSAGIEGGLPAMREIAVYPALNVLAAAAYFASRRYFPDHWMHRPSATVSCARWAAVLPAAALGGWATGSLGRAVLPLLLTPVANVGLTTVLGSAAFVYCGAITAPSRRRAVATILALPFWLYYTWLLSVIATGPATIVTGGDALIAACIGGLLGLTLAVASFFWCPDQPPFWRVRPQPSPPAPEVSAAP